MNPYSKRRKNQARRRRKLRAKRVAGIREVLAHVRKYSQKHHPVALMA